MRILRWWLGLLESAPHSPLHEDWLPDDDLLSDQPGAP